MQLFKAKETCSYCHQKKTRRQDEQGRPICGDCEIEQEERKLQEQMNAEPRRACPVDGTEMKKEYLEDADIVIDRCPACAGVFLDSDEVDALIEMSEDSGGGSNFATGLALGITIGH